MLEDKKTMGMLSVSCFVFLHYLKSLYIYFLITLPLLFHSELNNMGIWYRMGNVPRAQDSAHTPTTNNIQNVNSSSSNSVPLPAASMPKYVLPEDVVC